jgi:type I restriction enzyme, R subunit
MDPTEAQTRAGYIDRQLAAAGWQVGAVDLEVEYEVGSAGEATHGFSDYLLSGKDGRPLAVVEAKRTSRDALAEGAGARVRRGDRRARRPATARFPRERH